MHRSDTYRALEVGESEVADLEFLVRVGAVGRHDGLDCLQERFDVIFDADVDDGSDGLEEAHEVADLLLQVDDEFDAFNQDALDFGLGRKIIQSARDTRQTLVSLSRLQRGENSPGRCWMQLAC